MTGHVQPISDSHAIVSATFAVEWVPSLEQKEYRAVLELHPSLAEDLPRKQITQGFQFNIGPGIASGTVGPQPGEVALSGVIFDRVLPDGNSSWILNVQPALLTVACQQYDRWSLVWTKTKRYLDTVLGVLTKGRKITGIGLQYVDEFAWTDGAIENFRADMLFQPNRYLASHVFELRSLWHLHHGYLDTLDTPVAHKQLNNINVQVIDKSPPTKRSAQIVLAHRMTFDEPIDVYAPEMLEDEGVLFKSMKSLHELDKATLLQMLTPEMARRISLGVAEQ